MGQISSTSVRCQDSHARVQMGVRSNGSEAMHVLAGFKTIDSCNRMWKFLRKCKTLVRLPTVLMVKVVLFPRKWECPQFGTLTRYPSCPRRTRYPSCPRRTRYPSRVYNDPYRRPNWDLEDLQLYVEFSGTDLNELEQAVKRALSWSLSLLGRAPDYLSQRLGRSAGFPHALDYICGTCARDHYLRSQNATAERDHYLIAVRDHYLSVHPFHSLGLRRGVRSLTSGYVCISSAVSFHLHVVMHRRYFLHKFCKKISLWRMLVEFLCPSAEMLGVSQAMCLGVYALTMHVHMFNAAPLRLAIETLGSFRNWCTSVRIGKLMDVVLLLLGMQVEGGHFVSPCIRLHYQQCL